MTCPKRTTVNFIDKLMFIRQFAVNTCFADLSVYLQTGSVATYNLVMYLSGISMTEGVYTLLRPKMGRSTRHGKNKGERGKSIREEAKKLGKLGHGKEALPDAANLAMDVLDDVIGPIEPKYAHNGEYLFEVVKPLIRVGYYITIVSAPIEFGYDWYSGILFAPNSKCTQGHGWWGSHYTDPPDLAAHPEVPGTEVVVPHACSIDNDARTYTFTGGMWLIDIELGIIDNRDPKGSVSVSGRIFDLSNPGEQCGDTFLAQSGGILDKGSVRVARRIQGPATIQLWLSFHAEPRPLSDVTITWGVKAYRI